MSENSDVNEVTPALLIAAPATGQGKTTVAAGLARVYSRQGKIVRAFKCGADFNDPIWLELATGHPVHNIDLWLTGEADAARRLHDAAREADLIIIESAMGLFDGNPSGADLAERFGLPVLCVIDASAMVGTFGALAYGLKNYRPGLRWAGALANRVAGSTHAAMLETASRSGPADVGWLGAIATDQACELPERHLGLVPRGEVCDADLRIDAAADLLEGQPIGHMDLESFAVTFAAPPADAALPSMLAGRTIAIAQDEAFCFIYAANVQVLNRMGARITFFSPLRDEPLPECDAAWLPGGYPESHAATLSRARQCAQSIRKHADAGGVIWAECGGMMVLTRSLTDTSGELHQMWGLLDGRVTMQPRLSALGTQQLELAAGTLRGHTFHFSAFHGHVVPVAWARRPNGTATGGAEPVIESGSVRASYFHGWFASDPVAAASLFLPSPPWRRS